MEEKKTEENPAHKMLGRIKATQYDLKIKRVPKDTIKRFKELAEKEFCGDYGMTLKWLVDDIISADNRMIMGTLNDHHQRIEALENKKTEEAPKQRKMLDGSVRG